MASIQPGAVLGDRFEIVGELGRGGMATVWLVQDRLRRERIALKVVHPHLADQPGTERRLRREVQAASRVRHPAALVAHELHRLDGHLCLSLPLHTGRTLAEHVATHGPFSTEALRAFGERLASVLATAHRAGLVHRDVTPQNVMVDEAGLPALTDFGIARVVGRGTATQTTTLGTPGYLAPEAYEPGPPDPRTDLYALGGVLYFAATGAGPFAAATPVATLRRQLDDDHVPLGRLRPDLPDTLTAAVDALLRSDPGDRPGSAREVADLLLGRLPPRDVAPTAHRADEAPRPHLPPGRWRVVVRERPGDHLRRERLRNRRQGTPPDRFTHVVEQVLTKAWDALTDLLTLDPHVPPERQLTEAVAKRAGLPSDALHLPEAALQDPFLLVRDVDAATAKALADAASQAGFDAEATRVDPEEPRFNAPAALTTAFLGTAATFLGLTAFGHLAADTSLVYLMATLTPWLVVSGAVGQLTRRPQADPHRRLDLAFGPDLRPLLRESYAGRLPPPAATVPAGPPPAPEAAASPPPESLPLDPDARMHRGVVERLERLDRDLTRAGGLPEPLRADLRRTVAALRVEADRLHDHVTALRAEAATRRSEVDLAEGVDRLRGRLRRLETLDRDGRHVDPDERARLQELLRVTLADLDAVSDTEARLVRATARLLELATAAQEVRRDLFDEATPSQPVDEVLTRFREEVAAGREALAEVDALERARRARASAAPVRR